MIAQLRRTIEQAANLASGNPGVHLGLQGSDRPQPLSDLRGVGARHDHHAVATAEGPIAALFMTSPSAIGRLGPLEKPSLG